MSIDLPLGRDCGGGLPPLWADIHALQTINPKPNRKTTKPNDDRQGRSRPRPSAPVAA